MARRCSRAGRIASILKFLRDVLGGDDVGRTLSEAAQFFRLGRVPTWTLVVLPLMIIVMSILGALPPLIIGRIVDALQHRNGLLVVHELALYIGIAVGVGLMSFAYSYSLTIFRETLARNVQLSFLDKLQRARFDALSVLTLGQVTNRLLGDVRQLGSQIEYSLFPMLSNVCALVATIGVMARLDYRLTLIAFVCAFGVLLPMRVVSPRLARLQKKISAKYDDLYGTFSEMASIAGLAAYRNPVAGRRNRERLSSITGDAFRLRLSGVVVGGISGFSSGIIGMIGPSAVVAFGAYLVVHNQLSVGSVVAILIFQSRISGPISSLSQMQLTLTGMGVTVGRLLEISNLPDERSGTLAFDAGAIAFRDVVVWRDDRSILAGANLDIADGEHVALVGPSGAGKSSIASLLVRLYEPDAGHISIGGRRIEEFSIAELRSAICLVPQDAFLLDASMLENIALNSPNADQAAIERVVSIARLNELIVRLPEGMATVLGQRGFRLSGGERQRICLARALLQDPKILVLDEALTGVDVEMERAIISDVRAAFAAKTLIVITHRIESIRDFDAVVAVESGRVIASGSANRILRDSSWSELESVQPSATGYVS